MLNKPMNSTLKQYFMTLYKEAIQNAEKDFKTNILDETSNLEHFDKLKFLVTEEDRINDLIDKNKHPYYIKNQKSVDWLLTQFSNRCFLLNIDESVELKESLYLGSFRTLIHNEIEILKKGIPKFTFSDFKSGKECKYLNSFDNYYNIEKDDYYKIIAWQFGNLIKIVSYEVETLIKKHQIYCSVIDDPLDFINRQIVILEEELNESITNPKQLKRILSKLFAFKDVDIENYNNELLMFNYPTFFNDRIEYKRLNPSTVNPILNKWLTKPKTIFSNEHMLFYTLDLFLTWLKDIIKGKSIKEPFKYPIWEDLLNQIIDEAEQDVQPLIVEINDFAFNPINSKKKVRKFLRNEFEKQINKYNKFEDKKYFYLLRDENKNALFSDFKLNALFNNKKDEFLKKVKEAYIIQNISWEISFTYYDIFKTRTIYFKDDNGSYISINSLINQMVLEKDIYNEFENAMAVFFKHTLNDSLPLDFHYYNHRKTYIKLFEKCISRLQVILDNADPNNKVLYIQSRLKELKQNELKFRILIAKHKDYNAKVNEYPNLFKEFLSIEAEFITSTSGISTLQLLPNIQKPNLIENTNRYQSFKYLSFTKNPDAITNLRDSLIKNKFIDENTKLTDLKKIFSGGEINNKIIWIGNISELSHFIKNLIKNKKNIQYLKLKHWEVTKNCFEMVDKRILTNKTLKGAKTPASIELIKNALNNL